MISTPSYASFPDVPDPPTPLASVCSSLSSYASDSSFMGHSALKPADIPLTPQSSAPDSLRKANGHSNYSSLISVLTNGRAARDWGHVASDSLHQMSFSPTDRGGLFLLPVMSQDSQYSRNSVLLASSVTENFTLKDPLVNVTKSDQFLPLLSLPIEILYQIIEIVYYDEATTSISANLEKFLKTIPVLSKPFNQLAIRFLYKYAIFNRPHSFERFLLNIINQPDIGQYVEFMDFQTFTSIGLGRTGRMNQEIQMVTSTTIELALKMCTNLIEFQASENIQDDMDVSVLLMLFNHLPKIQALDFCGASLRQFAEAFDDLVIESPRSASRGSDVSMSSSLVLSASTLDHLFKISFHDCSNLPLRVFEKVLPALRHLRRLDLTHTSITSSVLLTHLPRSCKLTHLSLARCSKLTTKDLIQFLTRHPAVAGESLQWLNLQIDLNVVSPLTDQYLLFTLNNLHAPDLRYLNLGGMPVNKQVLNVIKNKFPNLESLAIPHSSVDKQDLLHLLHENSTIKFLDLTGIKAMDRRALVAFLKASESSLEAIEFDYKPLYELTGGQHVILHPVQTDFSVGNTTHLPQVWKFYDNEGRRSWVYRIKPLDPSYDGIVSGRPGNGGRSSNVVYYDLETGAKIETKIAKPEFLKYASRKINCLIGYYNLNTTKKKKYISGEMDECVWPVEFSQRGIYNYYSLNVK